jgi:hypothetical protein
MNVPIKKYPTIACCGIDCGLCPRFYTKGSSSCPGCGGENFKEKHPTCGFLTCCTVKKGFEVCSECPEYPCKRFEPEKEGFDSFVTHQNIFKNLNSIKSKGIDHFIKNQNIRINLLEYLLENFDEGRSKGFFCLACALLPLDNLIEIIDAAKNEELPVDIKEKSKYMRQKFDLLARIYEIELKLRRK